MMTSVLPATSGRKPIVAFDIMVGDYYRFTVNVPMRKSPRFKPEKPVYLLPSQKAIERVVLRQHPSVSNQKWYAEIVLSSLGMSQQ